MKNFYVLQLVLHGLSVLTIPIVASSALLTVCMGIIAMLIGGHIVYHLHPPTRWFGVALWSLTIWPLLQCAMALIGAELFLQYFLGPFVGLQLGVFAHLARRDALASDGGA